MQKFAKNFFWINICSDSSLPYLTLPPEWAGSYTYPALRPYQFGPTRIPKCNHKVTGSGYKAVDGCEAETSTKALVTCSKSALMGLVSS